MSELSFAGASISTAATRQNISIAALKQQLRGEEAIARMVAETVASGTQALNSSGRGQVVNLLT